MKKIILVSLFTVACFTTSYLAAKATGIAADKANKEESSGQNIVTLYMKAATNKETVSLAKEAITPEIEELEIINTASSLTFKAAGQEIPSIEFYGPKEGKAPNLEVSGKKMTLTLPKDHNIQWNMGGSTIKIGVQSINALVPTTVKTITIKSSSGDVIVKSLQLETLTATSSSGHIRIEDAKFKDLQLVTSSGNMRIDATAEKVTTTSSSGDQILDLEECQELNVVSTSGDIDVDETCMATKITSTSGDVLVKEILISSENTIKSTSGDVRIGVKPEETGAIVNFQSNSGDVDSDIIKKLITDTKDQNNFTVGNGCSKLNVTTKSGDLKFTVDKD